MLWIICPNCGRRPVEEYRFGGELRGAANWITDPVERDVDYVWMYDNVEGVTTERWFHAAGCRRWLTLSRDTTTDTVVA
ncbi:MAG: sarcosine oxidase subunit delta [Chloroflexi bacterium]|nr:sarcosine oxidase subunit delta [Chloroflexota bacterium]